MRIISSRVRSLEEAEGKAPAAEASATLAASRYATSLQTKYYLKLSKSLEDLAHGIISAFVVFKNLVYFLETDYVLENEYKLGFEDARQFTIRREILRAMAGHTCPEIYHFQSGTLPFFLLLIDEMQFWGRPTFDKIFDNFSPPDVLVGPDFSKNCWQFTIRLPVAEIGGGKQLFLSKASMFKKALRTAADSHRRDFTLDLRIDERVGESKGFSYRIVTTDQGAESFGVHPLDNDLKRKLEKLIIDHEPGAHEIIEDNEITMRLKSGSKP